MKKWKRTWKRKSQLKFWDKKNVPQSGESLSDPSSQQHVLGASPREQRAHKATNNSDDYYTRKIFRARVNNIRDFDARN
jgi:hypothetical protein